MDTAAVIARDPQVVLVDELAHTNVPGSGHEKRWQDIEEILDAGIDVISTVNIQHLESVNDVVEQITGVPQRETVPDEVVRRADQVEMVDMAAEALRRRMAHGNIYPPEKIDAALSNYFRIGNLTALRELALLWVADKVDDQLDRYRADHDISKTWEARERVVIALTGGPEGDTLIRRAARIADRSRGADLFALHVTRSDGLTGASPANLARQRVLGASRRGRFAQMFSRGVGVTTTARSGSIDVHMVTHEEVSRGRRDDRTHSALTRRRQAAGYLLAVAGPPLLSLLLANLRGSMSLPSDILYFLIAVIGVALVGGLVPALVAAVGGSLLLNYYFTPPYYTFTIAERENLLALIAFVAVAIAVSAVVDLAARRTREAARASADAEVLATLSGDVLRGRPRQAAPRDAATTEATDEAADEAAGSSERRAARRGEPAASQGAGQGALGVLLGRLRETYGLTSVTLLERPPDTPVTPGRQGDPHRWRVVAWVGDRPYATPDGGDVALPIEGDLTLVLRGGTPSAADRRVLEAFAAQTAVALRQQRLAAEAEQVRPLAEADRMRTALLSAVSHDLRTPLASAKAAVDSLRSPDVDWSQEDLDELATTAAESLDRLDRLVANLLDMSRLQAGALGMSIQPLAVEDVVARALDSLGADAADVQIQIPDDLPEVLADPVLLERVLVNLISNALRYNPPGNNVLVAASVLADRLELRVVDRGPGIPQADHDRVFLPFQRLGDRDNDSGVGLGLALSRGLVEAMHGQIAPDETPGGGLTMTIGLPVTSPESAAPVIVDRVSAWRERRNA
jgi:two-component system sensor histidine kinase KdpD